MLRHTLIFFSTITQRICYISGVFPCIYAYTRKQIKVIFYLNPSQQDMIFPFNDSCECLCLFIHCTGKEGMCTFCISFFLSSKMHMTLSQIYTEYDEN